MAVNPRTTSRHAGLGLIGLSFAVSASVTTELILQAETNPAWRMMAPPVAIGTFLTTLLVWKLLAAKAESTLLSTGSGALIGIVAHPVSAVFYVVLMTVVKSLVQSVDRPTSAGTTESFLEVLVFVVFWWSALALCGVGWITATVGAVTGFIVGIIHTTITRRSWRQRRSSSPDQPVAVPPPWSSVRAGFLSLLIVSTLSGIAWLTLHTSQPVPDAGLDDWQKPPAEEQVRESGL